MSEKNSPYVTFNAKNVFFISLTISIFLATSTALESTLNLLRIKLKVKQNINFIFNWTVLKREWIETRFYSTIHTNLYRFFFKIRNNTLILGVVKFQKNVMWFLIQLLVRQHIRHDLHATHASLDYNSTMWNWLIDQILWRVYQADLFQEIVTFRFWRQIFIAIWHCVGRKKFKTNNKLKMKILIKCFDFILLYSSNDVCFFIFISHI